MYPSRAEARRQEHAPEANRRPPPLPGLADLARYFLVDEITSIPEWQRGVKWVRDNTPAAGDCVVVTGSTARDVAAGSVFLAGRRGPDVRLDRVLLPMAFPEFARCAGFTSPSSPRIPFQAFCQEEGLRACQDALV